MDVHLCTLHDISRTGGVHMLPWESGHRHGMRYHMRWYCEGNEEHEGRLEGGRESDYGCMKQGMNLLDTSRDGY